ncbi:hypothetical protein I2483_13870 [Sporosarcina sp. E16_3]|uniref:hypothetical protein n=1 Tax=Sporosarcina sp. E16_3 TaxID=2789293 RepID=UPI001A90E44F|nr:hypothetical protein [Sporosarcina sp. E16_3]MBO0602751.1 hypothetical protein [Sporosarcina sp. E16_3]
MTKPQLKPGDTVRRIDDPNVTGVISYSTFGLSVIGVDPEGGYQFQTLARPAAVLEEFWERYDADGECGIHAKIPVLAQ